MLPRILTCCMLLVPFRLGAQQSGLPLPPPDTLASACDSPEYRQFDFWIGRWSVAAPGREPTAVNEISRQAQGCFLREQYHNDSGYTGSSTNWYDPADGLWRQLWIDNSGVLLRLAGSLEAPGRMVLSGDRMAPDGRVIRDRITWTSETDGTVHQIWDTSDDAGASWQNIFTGIYTRIRD
jgi:hypothetical protein